MGFGSSLPQSDSASRALAGRQLRSQDDSDAFYDYQFEPVWKFNTGSVHHTLLTGFEYQHQILDTNRIQRFR